MKTSLKLALNMILVILLGIRCKKDLVVPTLNKDIPAATSSGNAGWRVQQQQPTAKQRGATNEEQKVNRSPSLKGGQLTRKEIRQSIDRSVRGGRSFLLENGQQIYLDKLDSGRFNAVMLDEDGFVLENMKNRSSNELANKAKTDNWPVYIQQKVDNEHY
jgi:hypothetical protein